MKEDLSVMIWGRLINSGYFEHYDYVLCSGDPWSIQLGTVDHVFFFLIDIFLDLQTQ